jgi:hypothetical protein
MRIVVFGATGMVGTRVVDEVSARGHDLAAAADRNGSAPGGWSRAAGDPRPW